MRNLMIALAAFTFIVFSPQVMQAAVTAANVFVTGVLPALFPMMILNGLSAAGADAQPPGRTAAITVLFAFGAGSPASAQRLSAAAPSLTRAGLYGLAAATGVMSPMFIVGTLAMKTGLSRALWGVLICHWLGALTVGIICWGWMKRREGRAAAQAESGRAKLRRDQPCGKQGCKAAPAPRSQQPVQLPRQSIIAALPAAVGGAAQALLSVCGAMMLFSILAAVMRSMLCLAMPNWVAAHEALLAVVWAIMEIGGGGCAVIDAFPLPPLALLCGLCSFGGLSIWMQNLLFIGKIIRPGRLLLLRALHGAVSYGLCRVWFMLVPEWQTVFQTEKIIMTYDGRYLLALTLCLMTLACLRRASP